MGRERNASCSYQPKLIMNDYVLRLLDLQLDLLDLRLELGVALRVAESVHVEGVADARQLILEHVHLTARVQNQNDTLVLSLELGGKSGRNRVVRILIMRRTRGRTKGGQPLYQVNRKCR